MKITLQALLAAAALTISSSSPASLIGDTATCSFSDPGLTCSTSSAVVTPGFEFGLNLTAVPLFFIEIGASSVAIVASGAGGTLQFTQPNFILTLGSLDDPTGDIVGVTNFATANTTGITASDVAFTAKSVNFTFDFSTWSGGRASFDLLVGPSAVPEPNSLALLGIALSALALSRRRRKT